MMMINIYICQWLILRALLDIHIHMIVSTKILKSMIKLQLEIYIYILPLGLLFYKYNNKCSI